jgi:hypothetical protein
VISGQSRMMYQYLEPEPEGAICPKRSMPQALHSSPHDTLPVSRTDASNANWLGSNIQGFAIRGTDHKKRAVFDHLESATTRVFLPL